jgi:glycosyltransferase involved in cell wall biosynthesis
MHISFYAPFKPLGHKDPSGDLVIGTGLYRFLKKQGHELEVASSLRSRWISWKPWRYPGVRLAQRKLIKRCTGGDIDLWLTYHSYYKGPDLLGPKVTAAAAMPYVIFQGAYATKRRKHWRTRLGFFLNRKALLAADHVFANKKVDYNNLIRLLPPERVSYVAPGIYPEEFQFDALARRTLRSRWGLNDEPVVITAAMFRPGVKTESLSWVIRACGALQRMGRKFRLVIIGDGKEKPRIQNLANEQVDGRVIFVGKLPREQMYRYYSAGDVFVYPGIGESLGMVYLEAQSCGLPVVAFETTGVPEVVRNGSTGLLLPINQMDDYVRSIDMLLNKDDMRRQMGRAAEAYVRQAHDLSKNYSKVAEKLLEIVAMFSKP